MEASSTADEQTALLGKDSFCRHREERQECAGGSDESVAKDNRLITACRLAAAYYSFVVVGAWDGSYGALVVYLRDSYSLSYLTVSCALLAPVVGYAVSAFLTSTIHNRLGYRGIALIASGCHCIAGFSAGQNPPYPLLVVILMLAGLGNGIADASWNSWIGSMPRANGLMGLLHGFYGIGAACSPSLAAVLLEGAGLKWTMFYRLLGVVSLLELFVVSMAFWRAGRKAAKLEAVEAPASILQTFGYPSTWIISVFVFLYAATEISLADWISSYLIDVRGFGRPTGNSLTAGYWIGLTLGRVVVGFLASRMDWGKATVLGCSIMCYFACFFFVLVSDTGLCAIGIAMIGFFLGPLFPEAVVMQARLLPKHMQLAAIGFAVAFGSAGGSVGPFLVGIAADQRGIVVLQWFVLGMLGGCVLCWLVLPRPTAKDSACDEADNRADL
ncbi:Bypass of stop codon protein 6 [Pseudocercospora fuligena]|uniref:Bypass of stop codon protein 6 n=1 Tax=Pseudocercospora fuligena TaxID=685502 RepID=A0A8H6RE38_9PEZI|nr:Bypass of stop codon protein 6 [Pseudocercospora fuligena]